MNDENPAKAAGKACRLADPIRHSPALNAHFCELVQSIRRAFEGIVAKWRGSSMSPALRSGWQKMRIKPSPGVRHRRIHTVTQNFRCAQDRLLCGKPVNRTR